MYCAEAAVEDRKVHSYLQSQRGVETWKAGHLGLRRVERTVSSVCLQTAYCTSKSLSDRGSRGTYVITGELQGRSPGASKDASEEESSSVGWSAWDTSTANEVYSMSPEEKSKRPANPSCLRSIHCHRSLFPFQSATSDLHTKFPPRVPSQRALSQKTPNHRSVASLQTTALEVYTVCLPKRHYLFFLADWVGGSSFPRLNTWFSAFRDFPSVSTFE